MLSVADAWIKKWTGWSSQKKFGRFVSISHINEREAIKFLENYRWSSYQDYTGKKNFPSVINKKFLTEIIGDPGDFKKLTEEKILDQAKLNELLFKVEDLTLE